MTSYPLFYAARFVLLFEKNCKNCQKTVVKWINKVCIRAAIEFALVKQVQPSFKMPGGAWLKYASQLFPF